MQARREGALEAARIAAETRAAEAALQRKKQEDAAKNKEFAAQMAADIARKAAEAEAAKEEEKRYNAEYMKVCCWASVRFHFSPFFKLFQTKI